MQFALNDAAQEIARKCSQPFPQSAEKPETMRQQMDHGSASTLSGNASSSSSSSPVGIKN